MTVRKAHLNDASIIVEFWKEFMNEHDEIVLKENPKIIPYLRKYLRRKENAADMFKEFIEENIRSRDALVLIAEVEEEPVGYCLAKIQSTIPILIVDKIGSIYDLFVRKEFRGMGLSSQLMNETIKWLEKKSIKHVTLNVSVDNKQARKVYQKWGFMDFQISMRRAI